VGCSAVLVWGQSVDEGKDWKQKRARRSAELNHESNNSWSSS